MEFTSLIAGVVLLLLLLAAGAKGRLTSRQWDEVTPGGDDEGATEGCPEEFLSRIFLRGDWEFVRKLGAGGIERLFQQERKRVALIWVRQTSAMVKRVMRAHTQAARASANLEFSTEIRILGNFVTLMSVCGILATAIQLGGPLWLNGLAHFAHRLLQQLAKLQESMQAGVLARSESGGNT